MINTAEVIASVGKLPEVRFIGNTPVLSDYAQSMVVDANTYSAEMAILTKDPDPVEKEESESEPEAVEVDGEDPAHHNGNPTGFPTGAGG